ncbi:MAG: NAD(P)-dependent oxidoreductase, partial [Desulfobacterales bacterium]|nr:NAD(P)-dependent oxidoreductase [Desulfobacterales bacterium]MDX2512635.1 NAD(P)-dependent oxidoreductase [Desulfobacterales bacterium]
NILKAGHELVVHNRTREKELSLVDAGALRADTPREAAAGAEIIIPCVSDTPDVETIVLGDEGIIHGAATGSLLVDMSTISPTATRQMAATLAEKEIRLIDAPVSGGSEGAQNGTLAIMVGGEAKDVQYAMPVLEAMGKTITHVGGISSGQIAKAINQVVIAGTYLGVAEGMVLGMKAGLDMRKVIEAISGGAAGSWVLSNRAMNMVNNTYPLGFRVRLHHKDLRIALEAARELAVTLPVSAMVDQIENGLMGRGYGDEDMSAMARTLRELSGLDGPTT